MTTQNIYDDPAFFEGYAKLPRSASGLEAAPEWPTLRAMLPDLAGTRLLDLGCGYGWFCRWARQAGAAHVDGLDVSERMLARAAADTPDAAIHYARADLETIELPPRSYDLVYSSLTLHYIVAFDRLLAQVRRALVPGGAFVASMEHPLLTAPSRPGWVKQEDGRVWPLNAYLREGPRQVNWIAEGVIKQHRSVGTIVTALLAAGFTLTHLVEWGPDAAQLATNPALDAELDRPTFLLVGARG